jgi:hypothetical protein
MNLQLTKTLIDKIKPTLSTIDVSENSDIDNYHCTLLQFGRDNILLITNDVTLYSFVIFGLKSKDFKNIEEVIRESVFKLLIESGFPQNQYERVLSSMESFSYCKSSDRSILSTMTEMKKCIGYDLDQSPFEINHSINNMIFKRTDYKKPHKLFQKLLEESK